MTAPLRSDVPSRSSRSSFSDLTFDSHLRVSPFLTLAGLLATLTVVGCGDVEPEATSSEPASATTTERLRRTDQASLAQAIPKELDAVSIVVKFHEGTEVRVEGARLTGDAVSSARSRASIQRDLDEVTATFARTGTRAEPLFRVPRSRLKQLKERGERLTARPLADLSLYFEAPWTGTSRSELEAHLEALNALDSVEIAYVQPAPQTPAIPVLDQAEVASSTTPDFTALQGYVEDDANGIGVSVARALPGGRGEHVRIIDIEGHWTADHEDLPPPFFYLQSPVPDDATHGTGVAGVLVGVENDFGVTGISPLAGIGYASHLGTAAGVNAAFTAALNELEAGDVLLLEMQFAGPANDSCTCSSQCNSIPTEYYPAYFAAIQTATANGIVVVQAAGNGEVNLDDPLYGGAFDRSVRDSGAILVGASRSDERSTMCFSNYGDRIDVHAWGQNVTTTGGNGELYQGPLGAQDAYTQTFSGTSSASPIVAGAAALLQSIAWAQNDAPLSPLVVRDLLVSTGKPQQGTLDRPIGVLPDLATAAPLVSGLGSCGDAVCDAGESCQSCPGDCGSCTSACVPAGCEQAPTVTVPHTIDGVTDSCVFFEGPSSYVNSWNMTSVTINDLDVTNTWMSSSSFPATCDGGYYLRANANVSWAHVELR